MKKKITLFLVLILIAGLFTGCAKKEEPAPEAPAGPTQEELLAEIRDLLKQK